MTTLDPVPAFIQVACVPLDRDHTTGTLDEAEAIFASHPAVVGHDIHTAAILGDDAAVRRLLAGDPGAATATRGPRGWDALTHLCFSRYLRLDRARSAGFVGAAAALLDGGANPNTGWFERGHQPQPVWESALYGAAGVAHHAELTRLLLARGADPNDGETPYHAPETYDLGPVQALLESGRLTEDSLATMLIRKTDWHHLEGVQLLLQYGADPNRTTHWGKTALHNAILSDNGIEIVEVLLDHGADPTLIARRPDRSRASGPGRSAVAMAARRGRGDVLATFERRGFPAGLDGVEGLIAACARDDEAGIGAIAAGHPDLVRTLVAEGGRLLAQFAGNGNAAGVRRLLDLGLAVDARYLEGDGYFEIAPRSTALHVAAWRGQHPTVRLLIERGAPLDLPDGRGRSPLALAIRACVDSYWAYRRSPDSIEALLAAGAAPDGMVLPTGYPEADELLRRYQRPA